MLPDEATEVFLRDKEAEAFTERCWQDFHVAELDGRMVGMLFIVGEHIESLHLDPSEKRKGYGSLLMDFAETTIRNAGHKEATLDVLIDNRSAILFYKARGYRVVKEFTGRESGDTPVRMYRMVKQPG